MLALSYEDHDGPMQIPPYPSNLEPLVVGILSNQYTPESLRKELPGRKGILESHGERIVRRRRD